MLLICLRDWCQPAWNLFGSTFLPKLFLHFLSHSFALLLYYSRIRTISLESSVRNRHWVSEKNQIPDQEPDICMMDKTGHTRTSEGKIIKESLEKPLFCLASGSGSGVKFLRGKLMPWEEPLTDFGPLDPLLVLLLLLLLLGWFSNKEPSNLIPRRSGDAWGREEGLEREKMSTRLPSRLMLMESIWC